MQTNKAQESREIDHEMAKIETEIHDIIFSETGKCIEFEYVDENNKSIKIKISKKIILIYLEYIKISKKIQRNSYADN